VAVAAIAAVSIWPTWLYLHRLWVETTDYSHGYLVAGVALAWFVHRCLHLGRIAIRPSASGTCALAGVLVVWLVTYKASVIMGEEVLAPLIVWTSLWSCFGFQLALRLAAPIGYLYFAVPVWDAMAPVLQKMTIVVCQIALEWFRVPAAIHDSVVRIPEGTFRIAESCSGKRYFVAALALASIFVMIAPLRGVRAACLVALAAVLSLVANWFRVFTVIYAGHATNMRSYLVAREHGSFGWVVYFVVLVLIYWLGTRLEAPRAPAGRAPASKDLALDAGHTPLRSALVNPGIGLLCVALAAVLYARWTFTPKARAARVLAAPTSELWHGPLPPDNGWAPTFVGASPQTRGQYRFGDNPVEVFIAGYAQQRQGAKLISSSNTLLGESWLTLRTGRMAGGKGGTGIPARAILAEADGGQRWVVSFIYKVGDVVTSSDVVAQLVYGTRSWTQETPAEVVAVAVKCRVSCDAAETAVAEFWRTVGDQLLVGRPPSRAPTQDRAKSMRDSVR
jgi:EpsI family protein